MSFEERHMYKYVKIHEKWGRSLQLESNHFYHISEFDLKKCTIRLIEIARDALMSLVYAIDEEDRKKEHETAIPLMVMDYDDEWKV